MDNDKAPNVVQHPTLHFQFGDLIVQSAPTEDGISTLFRVSKSLLAYNSPVFAGMFTLPDASGQEMLDGVPVVRVTDTADDLAALLTALHNPSSLSFTRFDPDIPLQLTGIMRLATKYQFDFVRKRVIGIMEENWPQSFEQWLRFRSEISILRAAHASTDDGLVDGKSFEERIPEPAAAIRLARDFDISSILPFAFYTLAGIPRRSDWDDSREEGKEPYMRNHNAHILMRTARWRLLDAADYRALTECREFLATEIADILQAYGDRAMATLYLSGRECFEQECIEKICNVHDIWTKGGRGLLDMETLPIIISVPDPLRVLDRLLDTHTHWDMCPDCQEHLHKHLRSSQQVIWDSILTILPKSL